MIRLFWRSYAAALVSWTLALACVTFGPGIESRLFPVRTDQRVDEIVREPHRLCWRWSSMKTRSAISDNIDVFIHDGTGDRLVAYVFDRDTAFPWRIGGNVPAGYQEAHLCVLLPPRVGRDTPLRVEQIIYYRGWLGLWRTEVRVPDVTSPAALAESRHGP